MTDPATGDQPTGQTTGQPTGQTPRAARQRRPSRRRTLTESLGSIVLACEALTVFLASLVAFGLDAVHPLPPAAALIGGGVLFIALIMTAGLLRHRYGLIVGWVLQALLIATGFLVPVMFFLGAIFVAMWTYAILTGTRIDRTKETA